MSFRCGKACFLLKNLLILSIFFCEQGYTEDFKWNMDYEWKQMDDYFQFNYTVQHGK